MIDAFSAGISDPNIAINIRPWATLVKGTSYEQGLSKALLDQIDPGLGQARIAVFHFANGGSISQMISRPWPGKTARNSATQTFRTFGVFKAAPRTRLNGTPRAFAAAPARVRRRMIMDALIEDIPSDHGPRSAFRSRPAYSAATLTRLPARLYTGKAGSFFRLYSPVCREARKGGSSFETETK